MLNDCDCIIHVGPHFLHMNLYHFRANTGLLATGSMAGLTAFGRGESCRLDNLVLELKSAGCGESETIYAFLSRIGYSDAVVSECRNKQDEAELERVAVWEKLGVK